MAAPFKKYPIGVQSFEDLITDNYIYVDKTRYVYNLTHQYRYVFLSRPRRFGKSLLVSTLEAYFQGKKELFKGLAMEQLETEWKQYPVFRFDMSRAKRSSIDEAKEKLNFLIYEYEEIYGHCPSSNDITNRLEWLIKEAYRQTGQKAVLLIDEYDSPMLEVMHDKEKLSQFRALFRSFYAPIKSCSEYIKFGFITGITKFSQLSIFSEINNLARISMLDQWSGLCGITEKELLNNLDEEIGDLAESLKLSKEEAFAQLKRQYDGYHFSKNSEDVYNPYSLITAFCNKEISNYWFETGTPHWLIEQLRKFNFKIENLSKTEASLEDFDAPTENMVSAVPLLYQSGYITIKKYSQTEDSFLLGMPNTEVSVGLIRSLIPHYVNAPSIESNLFIGKFGAAMRRDDVSDALHRMRSFIASIPYTHLQQNELTYHTIFYIVSKLLLRFVDTEIMSSAGRSDMLIKTETHIYLFEFKFNGSLDKAILQIDEKGYPIPYECDERKLVKVAVNFNEAIRTIDGWRIDRGEEVIEEWYEAEE